MKSFFAKTTILQSIHAHSVLGLTVGVFMYLLCLTGTLLVVADYWERWEQPNIPEFAEVRPESFNTALDGFLKKVEDIPKTIYLVLPTASLPRVHVAGDNQEWWVDTQGNTINPVQSAWIELIKNIHIYLHLPETIGLLVVSIIGAIFIGLIISGIVAHPSIFKDAFKFRAGGNKRIELLDIHNRLSVWALPFHLMIGVTGAFFGLVGLLVVFAAAALYDGDRQALFDEVYGADPKINAPLTDIQFSPAFDYLKEKHPNSSPIYIAVQNYGTEQQYFEVAATFPQTLAYSEIFRFSSSGQFINQQDLIGGPIGRQVLYSVYRLHFGWFGGLGIQLLYIALGLSITVISVTGINLWLNKKEEAWLHQQWLALVWGFPLGLTVAAAGSFLTLTPAYLLLGVQLLCCIYCKAGKQTNRTKRKVLISLLGISTLTLSLAHLFYFDNHYSSASIPVIDLLLFLLGILLIFPTLWRNYLQRNLQRESPGLVQQSQCDIEQV